jgi:hypothetical protein
VGGGGKDGDGREGKCAGELYTGGFVIDETG